MGITMQSCTRCGRASFPPRSLCPHCRSGDFEPLTAYRGVIEEISVQRGTPAVTFASIRTDLGPTVVAKVVGEGGVPGSEIDLASPETQTTGGPVAVIPQPSAKEQ
ncbi:Zn-ribbon domain-containing OB-fold protein [Gordonia sp. 'Campus']|uniref:Zn-ribbon domain-containing OB-fold protein n=1 Tax=Gordonia sp. 'Campus' TaxID=2915824 RepID=UPI0035B22766